MDKKVERIINLYNRLYDGEVLVKSEGNYSEPPSYETSCRRLNAADNEKGGLYKYKV